MILPQTIIDTLVAKYAPQAIMLHGSRLRGDAGADSDYDVTIITESDVDARPYTQDGMMIDLSAEHPDIAALDAHGVPIWPLVAVYDQGGVGANLAARTKDAYDAGAPPLTAAEIENRKNFIKRYHQRLTARGGDPALRMFYLGELAERFIRFYFETRQQWTRSYHVMVAQIRAEDPAYAATLDELADRYYLKAIERLYGMLFDEDLIA